MTKENISDIPTDYKIEHDRLIYEMQPITDRLFEILGSLPQKAASEHFEMNGYKVIIIEDEAYEELMEKAKMAEDLKPLLDGIKDIEKERQ